MLSCASWKYVGVVQAVPLSVQRSLASNFDQRLREPQESGKFRHEACCVCCARRMWSEDLSLLILFQDPVLPEDDYYREPDVQSLHGSQQERLCDLLGVERYFAALATARRMSSRKTRVASLCSAAPLPSGQIFVAAQESHA